MDATATTGFGCTALEPNLDVSRFGCIQIWIYKTTAWFEILYYFQYNDSYLVEDAAAAPATIFFLSSTFLISWCVCLNITYFALSKACLVACSEHTKNGVWLITQLQPTHTDDGLAGRATLLIVHNTH